MNMRPGLVSGAVFGGVLLAGALIADPGLVSSATGGVFDGGGSSQGAVNQPSSGGSQSLAPDVLLSQDSSRTSHEGAEHPDRSTATRGEDDHRSSESDQEEDDD
jgi:hypothetical protein